jgi:hypothetical protein
MNLNRYNVTMSIFQAMCFASQNAIISQPKAFDLSKDNINNGYDLKPTVYAANALSEIFKNEESKIGIFLKPRGLRKPLSQPYVASFESSEKTLPICMLNSTHILPLVGDVQTRILSAINIEGIGFDVRTTEISEFFSTLVTLGGYLINSPSQNLLSRIEYLDTNYAGKARVLPI